MKKLLSFGITILSIVILLTGCGSNGLSLTSEEIIDKVYAGIADEDRPFVANTEIDSENMAYYLGVDNLEIEEGFASEPMMSSIAHSVVVIKLKDGQDVEKAKQSILENADARKWVCVEAEQKIVESNGNTIILIMSNNKLAPKIQENFKNLK